MTKCPPPLPQNNLPIPRSLSEQRDFANFHEKTSYSYRIDLKRASSKARAQWKIRGEFKSEGTSQDVHENKCRKNVTSLLSHDLDENRGGYGSYPTMFVKRNGVSTLAGEKLVPRKCPEGIKAGAPGRLVQGQAPGFPDCRGASRASLSVLSMRRWFAGRPGQISGEAQGFAPCFAPRTRPWPTAFAGSIMPGNQPLSRTLRRQV